MISKYKLVSRLLVFLFLIFFWFIHVCIGTSYRLLLLFIVIAERSGPNFKAAT